MWPHRKKSIGVKSGDLGGQAVGPPSPIQRSLLSGGEMFIPKRISFPISLRPQQPLRSNLVFLNARSTQGCVALSRVSRPVVVHLNIRSKLVLNKQFFGYISDLF